MLYHCRSLGCLDNDCSMCQNTPHRRCVGNFAPKYLSGDPVKAKCGAAIFVEVIDQATGRRAKQDAVEGLHLEVGPLHHYPGVMLHLLEDEKAAFSAVISMQCSAR